MHGVTGSSTSGSAEICFGDRHDRHELMFPMRLHHFRVKEVIDPLFFFGKFLFKVQGVNFVQVHKTNTHFRLASNKKCSYGENFVSLLFNQSRKDLQPKKG